MEKYEKKELSRNAVKVAAASVVVAGVGYISYLLGSQSGYLKAVDTVATKFPYMGFIKREFTYLSKLL